jgi:hypothetical protein
MNDQLKNLIKMSITDGKVSDEKMKVLIRKAKEQNIDEDELKIYIDHYLKNSKNIISESLSNVAKSSKGWMDKGMKSLEGADIPVKDMMGNTSVSFGGKLIYFVAGVAFISTFFNWFKVYARSTGLTSYNLDSAHSPWLGGHGFFLVLLLVIGTFLFWKRQKFWFIPGILSVLYAVSLGFFWENNGVASEVSMDFGEYGSAESGVKLLFGYYLFILTSIIYLVFGFLSGTNSKA